MRICEYESSFLEITQVTAAHRDRLVIEIRGRKSRQEEKRVKEKSVTALMVSQGLLKKKVLPFLIFLFDKRTICTYAEKRT